MSSIVWTTVFVLAFAVNFEPTRIGLITVALSRPRPLLQLLAFLCGSFAMTTSVGLLVLFVFHHGLLGEANFNGAKIQIAIGVLALAGAALLATNVLPAVRHSRKPLKGAVSNDPKWVAFQPAALRRPSPGAWAPVNTRAAWFRDGRQMYRAPGRQDSR